MGFASGFIFLFCCIGALPSASIKRQLYLWIDARWTGSVIALHVIRVKKKIHIRVEPSTISAFWQQSAKELDSYLAS